MSVETVDHSVLHLYPPFRVIVLEVLEQANRETEGKYAGFAGWRAFETYRSQARQEWLYAQGRTRPGPRVTNLHTAGRHGMALAADIVWYDRRDRPHWDGEAALWARLGHAARAHGLVWGGDWRSPHDPPHIQPSAAQFAEWREKANAWLQAQPWR